MGEDKKVEKVEGTKNQFVDLDTKSTNEMVIIVKGEEDRSYRFTMPFHSPLPECYNAALNVANEIARHFNEAVEKQKKKIDEEKAAKPEETVESVDPGESVE